LWKRVLLLVLVAVDVMLQLNRLAAKDGSPGERSGAEQAATQSAATGRGLCAAVKMSPFCGRRRWNKTSFLCGNPFFVRACHLFDM
jgi:hypothetical protein